MPQSNASEKTRLVQEILDSFPHASTKEFSLLLKKLQSQYSHWGPEEANSKWVNIADQALSGLDEYRKSIQPSYNLLRFLRLLSFNSSVQVTFSKQILFQYLLTIESTSGLIRNAGYQLLDNFKFGLSSHSDKPNSKHVRENWLQLHATLLTYELEFTNKYKPELAKSDLHGRKWRKHSTETKNITLKNIRRGLETIDCGMYFDEILDEFGMIQLFRTPEQINDYLEYKSKYVNKNSHLN